MDKTILMIVVLALGLLTIGVALADAGMPGGAQINAQFNRGQFPVQGPATVNIQAGNITNANLTTNESTYRWAGLYGNATGTLRLGDATGLQMYRWSAFGRLVYAARNLIDWTTLADASPTDVEGQIAWLNLGAQDNYTNTFLNAPENIGSGIWTAMTSDYALTYNDVGTSIWKTYSLKDVSNNIIFVGRVLRDSKAYSGQPADYQMIIPEDGTSGDVTTTGWKLYVELV